jgi:hypothetical protein
MVPADCALQAHRLRAADQVTIPAASVMLAAPDLR